jgi:hypothetical protein
MLTSASLSENEMASKLDQIEEAAMALPTAERAQLVTRLVASLDEATDDDVELAWIAEAEQRDQEAIEDPSLVESADAAFQRARDALR